MIHIIDNFYLNVEGANMCLYEDKMVQPLDKTKEASLKRVKLGNYNPYLNQGFKSIHQKLLSIGLSEADLTELVEIKKFLDHRSKLIVEKFEGLVLKDR